MPEPSERERLRVPPRAVLAVALALAALWAIDLWILRPPFPKSFRGQPSLAPLYAFWMPVLRPQAILFVAAALAVVLASRRLCDPDRTGRKTFAATLAAASVLLPLALFAVRPLPARLGDQFDVYRNNEFIHDARKIDSVRDFLASYVERMPKLSTHGRHFPPGHAVLLRLVALVFGPGNEPAGIAVLVGFAGAVLLAWLAIERVAEPPAARQGALLLLASPSALDFACTSMDAVFLLFATLAWWLALRAFSPGASRVRSILAGVSLLLATCFSFSALPVGLAVVLFALWSGRRELGATLRRLAWLAAGWLAAATILWISTGFSILACFEAARGFSEKLMRDNLGTDPGALRLQFAYGNPTAFLLGCGLALVPALVVRLRSWSRKSEPWTPAAIAALFVMSVGGIYFMETERIWLFAMPWLAAAAVGAGPFSASSLRLLLAAGLLQAVVMEVLLLTLW